MARRDASAEVVSLPHRPNTALVGAARRIDLQKRETDAYRRKAQAKEWQADALTYFGTIGIVKQSTYSLANTCSLARLFVAYQPDPEADPIAAPDGMVGVAEARDALDRLASGAKGGHASLIHRSVVQLKVPGECYLVGLEAVPARPATAGMPAVPAKPEEWLVASISEVQSKGDDYYLKRTSGREDGRKLRPPDETSGEGGDFLLRIWQEDAEYAEEADSALRGALGECVVAGTQVATWRGPVPVEEVEPGDVVWAWEDGALVSARVTKRWERGIRQTVTLRTRNRQVAVTPEHEVLVFRQSRPGRGRVAECRTEWLPAASVKRGDYLVVSAGVPSVGDRPTLPDGTPISEGVAWMLGAFAADGNLDPYSACFATADDADFRERLAVVFRDEWGLRLGPVRSHGTCRVNSLRLVRALRAIGFDERSSNREVPRLILGASEKIQRAFLAGYQRGDAHIRPRGHIAYALTSRRMAVQLRALHQMLGDRTSNLTREDRKPLYVAGNRRLTEHPLPLWRFEAYPDSPRRGRTALRTEVAKRAVGDDFAIEMVCSVADTGETEVYDLAVPGPRCFLADGTVAHNCEEYLILSRAVRATGRSRIAGAGILVLPSEADLGPVPELDENDDEGPSPEEVDDPATAAFAKKLLDAMVTPIAEEGDASAVVPIVVRIPGEHCDKLRHVKFERPADDFGNQRKHVIERLGMQLDIPLEEVIGITGSRGPVFMSGNTISQMDQKLWNRYCRPTMGTLCESLSVGFLRPMIEASGLDPSVAEPLMVWYDPASAIADPDPSESADEALDRGTISESAYRSAKGYAEGDAPTPDELQRRHDLGLLGRSGGGPQSGTFPGGAAAADDAHVVASPNGNGHRPHATFTAAARAPLGRRLASIDRSLRLQLSEIVDAAMRRALERAGARVRNKASKNTPLRASVATTPADKVPAKLGRAVVADALGLTDDELLAGQFDDIGGRFDHRVSQAQAQALAALADDLDLDDAEIASLQRSQDRDRHDAWIWLSGALLALAHERLYSPEPQAPSRGEFDASALVPSGIVREAMERAGGGVASAEGPPGGLALGDLVQSLWARHGRVVAGWTWLYGDPGSRTTPFEPHEALDGVEFANWTDPALTNNESWPPTDFFRPGDHAWCQCDFEPIGLDADTADTAERAMAGAE